MNTYSSQKSTHRLPRVLRDRPFLRGFIDWELLKRADRLGGRALAVYLVLQHQAALRKCATFRIGNRDVASFLGSIRLLAAHRNIQKLERAGLIRIERPTGCKMVVTITNPETKPAGSTGETFGKNEQKLQPRSFENEGV